MKQLSAADGQIISLVEYSNYQHLTNSWGYRVYIAVPDSFDNVRGNHETHIDGRRYVAIAGQVGYATDALATEAALQAVADALRRLSDRRH